MHGVQGTLVAGDADFVPQRIGDAAIVACLPHEGVNSLELCPTCKVISPRLYIAS